MSDMVNHPKHYISEKGIETIDVIEAFTADLRGIEATDTGNIIKYICRWKHKNGLQDLMKARWYLDHLIEHVEDQANSESIKKDEPQQIEYVGPAQFIAKKDQSQQVGFGSTKFSYGGTMPTSKRSAE